MKTPVAAAIAGLVLASTPTFAADLFGPAPPPMSFPASESPTAEVGANWYLRGDVGATVEQAPSFSMAAISMPTPGSGILPFSSVVGARNWAASVSGDIGVGYRYNNWLRFETTLDYRTGPMGKNVNSAICPTALTPEPIAGPPYSGYLYDTTSTCTGTLSLQEHNLTGLASAYVDLGTYWGVTPYVGVGAGLNVNTITGNVAYTIDGSGGTPYSANLTAPTGVGEPPKIWVDSGGVALPVQPNIGFTNQDWDRSIRSVKYSMAFALMGGVGIALTPSMTLDIGYRYLNAGTTNVSITPQIGSSIKQTNVSQDIRIGIRYMAN
jgi:opacity protein-like surface antigen